MRRIVVLVLAIAILLSGCSSGLTENEIKDTTEQFTQALRVYDRDAMSNCLTQFPDNTEYVYLDDIFNDAEYISLYQSLYSDITYTVKSIEKNHAVVEYTMPNVQELFNYASSLVLNLAISDETLTQKLAEDEKAGIEITRELMRQFANKGEKIETMTQQFTLTFQHQAGKTVILCDDQLRALITGNFFLSKNVTLESVNETAD